MTAFGPTYLPSCGPRPVPSDSGRLVFRPSYVVSQRAIVDVSLKFATLLVNLIDVYFIDLTSRKTVVRTPDAGAQHAFIPLMRVPAASCITIHRRGDSPDYT